MPSTETSRNLELLDTDPAAGGCGCGSGSTADTAPTSATASATTPGTKETTMASQTYSVTGMTCGHCANAVTSELTALDGVSDVRVDLVAGGTSTVTVTSVRPLDETQVAAALDEAGDYQVV